MVERDLVLWTCGGESGKFLVEGDELRWLTGCKMTDGLCCLLDIV